MVLTLFLSILRIQMKSQYGSLSWDGYLRGILRQSLAGFSPHMLFCVWSADVSVKSWRSCFGSQSQLGLRTISRTGACLPCHSYILQPFYLPCADSVPEHPSLSRCFSAIHQPILLLLQLCLPVGSTSVSQSLIHSMHWKKQLAKHAIWNKYAMECRIDKI